MAKITRINPIIPTVPRKNDIPGKSKKVDRDSGQEKRKSGDKPKTGHLPGRLDEIV